jgi:hypothetical protein
LFLHAHFTLSIRMSKADMTPEERDAKEQEEFNTGPLRVLTDSVKNNTQVEQKIFFQVFLKYLNICEIANIEIS